MTSLLLVGYGKMGSALIARWQHAHPSGIRQFYVIEPEHYHANNAQVTWFPDLDALPADISPEVIVFAVKPQLLSLLLPEYQERFNAVHPLYLSIAAGKTLRFFTQFLGEHARVVRAMPNIAALVGEAITGLCATPSVPASAKNMAGQIMQAVGQILWLEDEMHFDIMTALSGSGPAYVFLFLESLTKGAIKAGLAPDLARRLAIQTVSGSCKLAAQSMESFEDLRKRVTSPGGTTEAALAVLMQDNRFEIMLSEALQQAVKRAGALAG